MTVPAAIRVLDLIETFASLRRPMSVAALAKAMKLPPSSCHGLVKTLEQRGYLVDHENFGGYYFTKRLEEHARRIGGFDPLPSWIHQELMNLRDESGETVMLAKLSGTQAVYVAVIQGVQNVRYIAEVGDTRPLHATAVGKALLGGLDVTKREEIVEGLQLPTSSKKTITERKLLLKDIEASQTRGWFISSGEYLSDVMALAVPVHLSGGLYAAVVSGPLIRMEPHLERLATQIAHFSRMADLQRRQHGQ